MQTAHMRPPILQVCIQAFLLVGNLVADAYQTLYLTRAADLIDALNYYYNKYEWGQIRKFPRSYYDDDGVTIAPDIPDNVLRANVLIALVVWSNEEGLDDVDDLLVIDSRDVVSENIGAASFTYENNVKRDKFTELGIPLPASDLLRPFLANWRNIPISRGIAIDYCTTNYWKKVK